MKQLTVKMDVMTKQRQNVYTNSEEALCRELNSVRRPQTLVASIRMPTEMLQQVATVRLHNIQC
jgi:hypothetical protein